MDSRRKVVSELHVRNYVALALDGEIPRKEHNRYIIEGVEYNIVPVYDMPRCIGIEAEGSFIGKEVEFVLV